jgi:hypothetical protein
VRDFDLASAHQAVAQGALDSWLDAYLTIHNVGLRDGLRLQTRYWLGQT